MSSNAKSSKGTPIYKEEVVRNLKRIEDDGQVKNERLEALEQTLAACIEGITRLECYVFPMFKLMLDRGDVTPEMFNILVSALTKTQNLEQFWGTDVSLSEEAPASSAPDPVEE